MTIDDVTSIASSALFLVIKVAAPVLLVSLVIGLIVSIFQTVTSIQEQTLTFVPKLLAIFISLMLIGGWIANSIGEYVVNLWSNFSMYIR